MSGSRDSQEATAKHKEKKVQAPSKRSLLEFLAQNKTVWKQRESSEEL